MELPGSAKKGLFSGSPIDKHYGNANIEYKAYTNQHTLKPSNDLLNLSLKASGANNRPIRSGVMKGKITLGIDYEGIEKGAHNVTENPNRNRIAQSIEVAKNARLS